ncbi:hypothetical protein [Clostridium uliginosum]|uniref:Uncharacterized protein n=1 Tax=Clostridium uliginosum TaxID=119641 RepID=A0A1I1INZ9_9CLOT|nr:hypothetical protein [Clostridium uliginosum]SFC37997.1 hypothetical protein SAMN05421842_10327 [Clostridium uliginosum]
MENEVKNITDEYGVMVVADFTTNTKIRFKYLLSRTIGGMYVLEKQSIDLDSGEVESEIINTRCYDEVKKWCARVIMHESNYA